MLAFVKNKIFSKKWMVISLLIGNILLISIAACSPMYSDAVLQRMLLKNLTVQMERTGRYPGTVEFKGIYNAKGIGTTDFDSLAELEALKDQFIQEVPVPVAESVTEYYKSDVSALHEAQGGNYKDNIGVRLEAVSDFENHVNVISGELPSKIEGNVLEAVVSQKTLVECRLAVGEVITLEKLENAETGEPYQIKITGIIEPKDQEDPYWFTNPNKLRNYLFLNQTDFVSEFVENPAKRQSFSRTEYVMLDYQKIQGDQVYDVLELCDQYQVEVNGLYSNGFYAHFYETMDAYLVSANKLDVTLVVLQIPIFLLLAAFIFMVSGQMLGMEQNEISMIKSRGASRKQILTIYLLQSTLLAVISFVIALPLSYLICQVVGSANAFLEFVQRRALPARFYLPVWLFGLGAVVISIMTMVLPAIRYSKVGIVDHKRSVHKKKKPMWQKIFLDIVLLGVSLYGLYSYNNQSAYLATQLEGGASLDPLLYLCSSMFILGSSLFIVRVFPLLVKIIFSIFKKLWSPALYASFLRMLRSRDNQNFIMIFLILTMALGIFSAETAHTINNNAEEKIRYSNGADIAVLENWYSQKFSSTGMSATDAEVVFTEPDFTKYLSIEGAEQITKVLIRGKVKVIGGSSRSPAVTLMGINTKEFGETCYMKDGLLKEHWYNYLNAMAPDPEGVIVSTSFRDKMGYKLGDRISYYEDDKSTIRGIIYGFVDYWPSMIPPEAGEDGESYFIIAHLSQVQMKWGMLPYQVWMKNAGESSQYIYDFAEKEEVSFEMFKDTNADLIDLKNDPVFQATNGILTVGFIVVLVLCSVGFLIYWILSIQSRALQFGIFRAMGMSMKEVLGMLVNEQIFISGVSIISGVLVGRLAAQLYVPLIQMAYSSADQLIPLEISSAGSDQLKLYLVVGVVMIVCMVILGWMIKKIKIAQALKLGED